MKNDFRFARFIKNEAHPTEGEQFYRTPTHLEREFFGPNGLVERICVRFREAGVSEADCQRYERAVKAFFDRPTKVTENDMDEVSFTIQRPYFSPWIQFPKGLRGVTDVLTSFEEEKADSLDQNWKPRLTREKSLLKQEIVRGSKAFQRVTRERGLGDKGHGEMEAFFVQINRFMYALHESIHILEGFLTGDLLNNLLAEVGALRLADSAKMRQFLQLRPEKLSHPVGASAAEREHETSVLGYPAEREGILNPDGTEFLPDPLFVMGKIETTIDFCSQWVLRDSLKKHPDFALWCHNALSMAVTALREFKTIVTVADTREELDELQRRYTQINNVIDSLAPVYFTMFSDSEMARSEIQAWAEQPVTGRYVGGTIAVTPVFTRLEIENLKNDTVLSSTSYQRRGVESHTYPLSGRQHLVSEGVTPMMTDKGVEIATRIILEMDKRGLSYKEVEINFHIIENCVTETDPIEGEALRKQLCLAFDKQMGIALTDEELQELFGVSEYLRMDLLDNYQKRFALRRSLLAAFEAADPEKIDFLIRDIFVPIEAQAETYLMLIGFYLLTDERPLPIAHWNRIQFEESFGIFGISIPRLSKSQLMLLKAWYVDFLQGALTDKERFQTILRTMAAWKRSQATSPLADAEDFE